MIIFVKQLDRRVLESCGDLGVPKLDKKPLTNPRCGVISICVVKRVLYSRIQPL